MKMIRAITVLVLTAISATALIATPWVQVFPSGPTVPENLLRIELRFPAPLQQPLSVEHVKLTDTNGVEIDEAFLDLLLPSSDGKRMTMFLHPGRVKAGVGANLALGRALHAGATVTLVIIHPALSKAVRKTWQVKAFDAEPPRPSRWSFELPRLGSRSPLLLHLDKPISSSAESLIAIRGPGGQRLPGDARLESGETVWHFVPTQSWQAGSYAVATHPDLEDAAGNRPCAPFEVDRAKTTRSEEGDRPFEIIKKKKL